MSWLELQLLVNWSPGSVFFSIRRTGILNLDSSMAAIMPVGPAPAIKTGFKSSLMFALQSAALPRNTSGSKPDDWCCHSISRAYKQD